MKNLVFNFAIALVVIAYVTSVSTAKKQVKESKENSTVIQTSSLDRFPIVLTSNKLKQKDVIGAGILVSTGNTSANVKSDLVAATVQMERVGYDANQMNSSKTQLLSAEVIENMFSISKGKTIEEIIAEDNAIIENDFSNETQTLDFVAIENDLPSRIGKTMEEVIAEDNVIIGNPFSNETQALDFVAIENSLPNRIGKTIDEVIAEDNAIIGNDFSNETQALDFNVINAKSQFEVTIDNIAYDNSGKTIEEIIAEDNEIIGNTFSNETRSLDLIVLN
jgi:hypothetical protein